MSIESRPNLRKYCQIATLATLSMTSAACAPERLGDKKPDFNDPRVYQDLDFASRREWRPERGEAMVCVINAAIAEYYGEGIKQQRIITSPLESYRVTISGEKITIVNPKSTDSFLFPWDQGFLWPWQKWRPNWWGNQGSATCTILENNPGGIETVKNRLLKREHLQEDGAVITLTTPTK